MNLILQEEKAIRQFLPEKIAALCPTTSSLLARKQMKNQFIVTAAIPCLALRVLKTGAEVYGYCYREGEAEPRPMSRVKAFELREKPDESASCAFCHLKQLWRQTDCVGSNK